MIKYGGARQIIDDSIVRRMHIACWITKARIQTHTATMVKRRHLSITWYVRFL